jgi:trehalose 6-phosphate phosphatase
MVGVEPGGSVRDELVIHGGGCLTACLAACARDPRQAALLCDIDGTISPIVARPTDALVPQRFRDVLAGLVARLGLVAFVTGRALDDGRRMVSLEGVAYVGTHGLDIVDQHGHAFTDPQAQSYVAAVQEVARAARRDLDCEALGVVLEDKRAVLAIHYRLAPDPARSRHEILTRVVEPARRRGLAISTGHFLFEVRPPLPFSKGTATRRLLAGGEYMVALFCGDDLTDVTGFKAVHEWRERDARRSACALAAVTGETPRPVIDEADVQVRSTAGVYETLLHLLAAVEGEKKQSWP